MFHLFTARNYQVTNDTMSPWQGVQEWLCQHWHKRLSLYKCAIFQTLLPKLLEGLYCPIGTWAVQVPGIIFQYLFCEMRKYYFNFINIAFRLLATKYFFSALNMLYSEKSYFVSGCNWRKISNTCKRWVADSTWLLKVRFSKVYDKHLECSSSLLQKEILR